MMKINLSIIAILLAASSITSQAADNWTRKADFGGAPRAYAVGFSIGGKGYMGTGFSLATSTYYGDWWEYDPATNVWTQKADFGGGTAASGVGFAIDGVGYLLCGGCGWFWQFDPVVNTWTRKADFPGVARLWAVGFSIGEKGYVGTGTDLSLPRMGLNDFWEYDPATDTWTRKADLPGPRYSAAGFSIGSKGYIGIGDDNDGAVKYRDFWEYDPAADSWTRKADFLGAPQTYAVGLSIGTKGYIGTGNSSDGTKTKQFYEYDPTSDTWTRKADFGGQARAVATGFSIGGKGYIGIGLDNYGFFRDFLEYTQAATQIDGRGTLDNQGNEVTFNFRATQSDSGDVVGWFSFCDPAGGICRRNGKIRILSINGNAAEFGGSGILEDGSRVRFDVTVTDNGMPGISDTISISLSNGYSVSGSLTSGDIRIY